MTKSRAAFVAVVLSALIAPLAKGQAPPAGGPISAPGGPIPVPAPAPAPPKDPELFPGKILIISTNRADNTGAVLGGVSLKQIGQKMFLSGNVPAGLGDPWPASGAVLVSVDLVTQIVLCDNVADAKKLLTTKKP